MVEPLVSRPDSYARVRRERRRSGNAGKLASGQDVAALGGSLEEHWTC